MEHLKDPSMLLSIANSVGIAALYVYQNKQIQDLTREVEGIKTILKSEAVKVRNVQEGYENKTKDIKDIMETLAGVNRRTKDLSTKDIKAIKKQIRDLTLTLEDNGIASARSTDVRRSNRRRDDSDSEDSSCSSSDDGSRKNRRRDKANSDDDMENIVASVSRGGNRSRRR